MGRCRTRRTGCCWRYCINEQRESGSGSTSGSLGINRLVGFDFMILYSHHLNSTVMSTRNLNSLERLTLKQRTELHPSLHTNVDVFLKTLKPCYRRFQAALVSLENEGQILERIYYKGKNQHRSALFWRRIAEMRRFSNKVVELNALRTMTCLARSFFGGTLEKEYVGLWTYSNNHALRKT